MEEGSAANSHFYSSKCEFSKFFQPTSRSVIAEWELYKNVSTCDHPDYSTHFKV
jgi:hypothetical protein